MSRRLVEILADLDRAMKCTEAAPLLEKHKPALESLRLIRQALDLINVELQMRPPGATM